MATPDSTPRTIEIPLNKGYIAIVDEQDADLAVYKWHAHINKNRPNKVYVMGYYDGHMTFMHRVILSRILGRAAGSDELADHINNIGTDNTRQNIRLATYTTNAQNSVIRSHNTAGYKGVSPVLHGYTARIKINKKQTTLGRFETALEAACAYNDAAIKYFGEFACLNDIPNWQDVWANTTPLTKHFRNTSGYKGVSRKRNKWRARVMIDGKQIEFQGFDTAEQARDALADFLRSLE